MISIVILCVAALVCLTLGILLLYIACRCDCPDSSLIFFMLGIFTLVVGAGMSVSEAVKRADILENLTSEKK
jgi:ABC-type sulfate transport system permease component